MSTHGRRLLGRVSIMFALAGGAMSAVPVSVAAADPINLSACNTSAVSHPFARWGDLAPYELAPGGDFEASSPAWTLNGGAKLVPGSEPYAATGTRGFSSLALPAGSSAESPLTCVDAAYPSARFFISGTGSVAVTIVDRSLGIPMDIPAGVAVAGSWWMPTPVMLTTSAVLGATSNGVAQVSLRITALSGKPRVDDVFIDPWFRS